jgi:hypothetical protein
VSAGFVEAAADAADTAEGSPKDAADCWLKGERVAGLQHRQNGRQPAEQMRNAFIINSTAA